MKLKNITKIKSIPTLIGLVIVALGLGVSVFLVKQSQNVFLRARTTTAPHQVKISNVSSQSLTISWLTAESTIGQVKFGQESNLLNKEVFDERDNANGGQNPYFSHYVTLKDLEPATTYFLEIFSSSQKFNHNGQPYEVQTAPEIGQNSQANDLAYGTVLTNLQAPAEGALVYLNMANSSLQSSLVSSSGNWAVPLNLIRSADLTDFISYDPTASTIEIFVQYQDQTASALTTTNNDSPVPPITIGESLDFREKATVQTETEVETTLPSGFSLEDPVPSTPSYSLSINNPQEGENLATSKPLFLGKGPAGQEIDIEIHSPQMTGTTTTNQWGDWNWSPPQELDPGEHTIIISYLDEQNQTQTTSHSFTVLAAETSDLPSFTATPEGTLTPTEVPTATESPSPTPTITATPSPEATPTATTTPEAGTSPTLTPSPSPTPSPTATPTPVATISVTPAATTPGDPGFLMPTLAIFILGVILLSSGLLLNFF